MVVLRHSRPPSVAADYRVILYALLALVGLVALDPSLCSVLGDVKNLNNYVFFLGISNYEHFLHSANAGTAVAMSQSPQGPNKSKQVAMAVHSLSLRVNLNNGDQEELWFATLKLGEIHARFLDDWPAAHQLFMRAMQLEPKRPDPLFYLGQHFRIVGEFETAFRYLRRAAEMTVSLSQPYVWALLHTCLVHVELGRAATAGDFGMLLSDVELIQAGLTAAHKKCPAPMHPEIATMQEKMENKLRELKPHPSKPVEGGAAAKPATESEPVRPRQTPPRTMNAASMPRPRTPPKKGTTKAESVASRTKPSPVRPKTTSGKPCTRKISSKGPGTETILQCTDVPVEPRTSQPTHIPSRIPRVPPKAPVLPRDILDTTVVKDFLSFMALDVGEKLQPLAAIYTDMIVPRRGRGYGSWFYRMDLLDHFNDHVSAIRNVTQRSPATCEMWRSSYSPFTAFLRDHGGVVVRSLKAHSDLALRWDTHQAKLAALCLG
eukprot:TRINITY_DN10317_c0_g1_i1.p1 TRINITY_DN10317_c0_g1~~TRINITY_DN10317_c0_g1_i1.p1  ORF type:complete len:490 (-),score=52.29 TRINITY_DN10317_c0_g1_i1:10-1479(-)